MTLSEINETIETYRYRAPAVVPLPNGAVAVLTPGQGQKFVICDHLSALRIALQSYIDWNVLEPRPARSGPSNEDILNLLKGVTL